MADVVPKTLRCAIYTRKSTEHGLELEFNSLDAQRDACEAYIKSQASLGWKTLSDRYDDPAFSGGNLDRPALQQLLIDIKAGQVDVVVVYKIDRLTRSLADFAKLVEAFDAQSISFVAVTQQFNTTTSMGRLTLNILLSFAQFERELSSERVRDKIAASRRKGKWTGGTAPLGYDIENKKLMINKIEAESIRTIFSEYVRLQSINKLIAELDRRKIVTKRRDCKAPKYQGGISFMCGPLAYLLKNRIYLGEMRHGDKWFPGEHKAIVDRALFDRAQAVFAANTHRKNAKRFASGALLTGKLFDDLGNRMSSTYTSKKGVRYRFYASSAVLRGRKSSAGLISRVPAFDLERDIDLIVKREYPNFGQMTKEALFEMLARVDLKPNSLSVRFVDSADTPILTPIKVEWSLRRKVTYSIIQASQTKTNTSLLQAIVRAHGWLKQLTDESHETVEALAESVSLHSKVVRQNLRLAFLPPEITASLVEGGQQGLKLSEIPKTLPLLWASQLRALKSYDI